MAEKIKKKREQKQVNIWLDAELVEMLDMMRAADYLKRSAFAGTLIRSEWNRRYEVSREIKKVKAVKSIGTGVSA